MIISTVHKWRTNVRDCGLQIYRFFSPWMVNHEKTKPTKTESTPDPCILQTNVRVQKSAPAAAQSALLASVTIQVPTLPHYIP